MADDKKKGGVIASRSKDALILPPGPLGFSNLITPDEYEGTKRFDLFVHWSPQAQERAAHLIATHVVEPMWQGWVDMAAKAEQESRKKGGKVFPVEPKGGWEKPDPMEWIEGHLRQPNERSKVQLPSLKFANEAEYKDRKTGAVKSKTMKAYDGSGKLLDLPKLKLGMGSLIQPIVMGGLFISALYKQPQLSFKLQGLRVLALVQYGAGGGGAIEEVSDEDLALAGTNFTPADLSAYVGSGKAPEEDAPSGGSSGGGSGDYGDDDDEIPF